MRRRIGRDSRRCERTGKIRYRDEKSARTVIRRAKRADDRPVPIRAYYCTHCAGWHLTKQEKRDR